MIFIPEKHKLKCLECNKEFDYIFTDQEILNAIPKKDGSKINPMIKCPHCEKEIEIKNLKSIRL